MRPRLKAPVTFRSTTRLLTSRSAPSYTKPLRRISALFLLPHMKITAISSDFARFHAPAPPVPPPRSSPPRGSSPPPGAS